MATILKSKQLQFGENTASVEVFNWEDVATKAKAYLATVKQQAEDLLRQAQQDGERLRVEAQRAGLAASQSDIGVQAEKLAMSLAEERVRVATSRMEALAEELEQATHQWLRQWQHETIPLAISIAERLVHRQIELDPSILLNWLQESVRLAQGNQKLELRMHPSDIQVLGAALEQFINQQRHRMAIELIEDPAVERHGIVLQAVELTIDQQLSAQLSRLREELQ
jgi:flagellar biosynthesis/type III secretory pathway protein FliH